MNWRRMFLLSILFYTARHADIGVTGAGRGECRIGEIKILRVVFTG